MVKWEKRMTPSKKKNVDLQSRIREFNKRWNVILDETEEFEKFRHRILAVIDNVVGRYILQNVGISRAFAFALGDKQTPGSAIGDHLFSEELLTSLKGKNLTDNTVYQILSAKSDLPSLVQALQTLFWVLEEKDCPELTKLANAVQIAVDYSPGINLQVARKNNQVLLYPAGAKLLEEKIVNETLMWLADYPNVAKHFEEALRIYLSKDETKYRNLLDNLRFALEQVLRSILNNRKSLEKQPAALLPWLKVNGIHQQVINMYVDLLVKFSKYQNDAVKHGDKWSLPEIELMIYLTGAFIRFLLQLNKSAVSAANARP
jgi:hypothetical protein